MSAAYRRKTPVLRYALCAAIGAAAIGAGIGISAVWPWGFAHPPGSLDEPQAPAPGPAAAGRR